MEEKRNLLVIIMVGVVMSGMLRFSTDNSTIDRMYSCEANGNTLMAEFHKDGTVLMGTNGSFLEYDYERIDKDVYRISKFGEPVGDVVATKKGFFPVGVGEGISYNKDKVLSCEVR